MYAPPRMRVAHLQGLPVVGKLLDFRRDRLALFVECAAAGDIVSFPMVHRKIWCISSPELVHELLVAEEAGFIKAPGLSIYGKKLLGDGLLTAEKEVHRRKRKLLAPAFAAKRIAGYGAAMAAAADRAAARWRPGGLIDVADEMMRLTLAIVGKTLFDAEIEGDAAVVGEALTEAMEFMIDSITLPLPMQWPLPRNRRMRAAVGRLDDIVYRIIAERRAAPGDRGDVLSIMLEARDDDGSGLTDRDVRDEIMTLMLAGHETTANALAWTWYLLSQHPDAEARLLAEVDAAIGDRLPTVEDLPRMPWTLQVIEEAMRLYPPAFSIGRLAERRVQLGPATIEPGEVVLVTIRGIQRRPDLWPEPAAFRPERMTEDAKKARPRYAYMPFGAGPRICIGNHFALMEAHLLVATIARRWRFRLAQHPDIVEEPLVTLRPRGGVHVEAIRR
jgi:cytochrome P450